MSTHGMLLNLSKMTTKNDYLKFVKAELDKLTSYLQNAGYKINSTIGLVGLQSLHFHDILDYHNFRELHFIYHGLASQTWKYDPADKQYFSGLEGFVTNQFNNLP